MAMKRNRFALLLLLVVGGLFTSISTSGSHQVTAAPTVAHTCQHAAGTMGAGTGDTAVAQTQSPAPNPGLSERLVDAVDAFARLVMVM